MQGPVTQASFGMLMAIHGAVRRDFDRLIDALDALADEGAIQERAKAIGGAVEFFTMLSTQLEHHHVIEDEEVWPPLRALLGDRASEVLDAMEAEHREIVAADDAARAAVNMLVTDSSPAAVRAAADAVRREQERILGHLAHEEQDAVPLMFEALDEEFWMTFQGRRQQDPGNDVFLPWVFDGMPADAFDRATGAMPPPVKAMLVEQWIPAHAQRVAALPTRR